MADMIKCGCGKEVEAGSKRCPFCGRKLGAGKQTCPVCKTQFPADGVFCPNCDYSVQEPPAEMSGKRWRMGPGDIAASFEEKDLDGAFEKGVVIEQGAKGLLIQDGVLRGALEPGQYPIGGVLPRLKELNFKKVCRVVIVKTSDIHIAFSVEGVATKEGQKVGVDCEIAVTVSAPEVFLGNLLLQKDRYTLNDIQSFLSGEIRNSFKTIIAEVSMEELCYNRSFKARLAAALEYESKVTLERNGISVVYVRVIDYHSPEYEKLREAMGKKYLGEKWNDINKAIRGLLAQDKLDEWTSEVDFEKAVRAKEMELLRQRVINDEEMEELKRIFRAHKENADLLQRQTIDRLVNEFRRSQNKLDILSAEEAKIIQYRNELQRELETARNAADIQRLKFEIEKMEDEWDLILKERNDELNRKDFNQRANWVVQYQKDVNFNQEVFDNIMISTLRGEQLEVYERVKKLKIFGAAATPEQILAASIDKNPQVIEVFKERYRGEGRDKIEQLYSNFLSQMTSVAVQAVTNRQILSTCLSPNNPLIWNPGR